MIIKQKDGTILEMTATEFAELGGSYGDAVSEEVLSEDNVKEGEYFVITGNNNSHEFEIGEIVKAKSYADSTTFKAERMDESDWWYVYYTDVRRATDVEIAEATKPKEVKFEIGDVVKARERFGLVTHIDSQGDYWFDYLVNRKSDWTSTKQLRHATEEEKSHLQTLIGREKYEYKIGDLVRLEATGLHSSLRTHVGSIFEISHINEIGAAHLMFGDNRNDTLAYTKPENLKLITPVEWRHDFK